MSSRYSTFVCVVYRCRHSFYAARKCSWRFERYQHGVSVLEFAGLKLDLIILTDVFPDYAGLRMLLVLRDFYGGKASIDALDMRSGRISHPLRFDFTGNVESAAKKRLSGV